MHRLRVEFRRESDHLVARQAARPMLENAARREILEGEFSHVGGTAQKFSTSLKAAPLAASTARPQYWRESDTIVHSWYKA
jgi:hypothetical protein